MDFVAENTKCWPPLLGWIAVLSLTLSPEALRGEPAPLSIKTSAAVVTRYVDSGARVADESGQAAVEVEQGAVYYGAWLNEPWKGDEQDAREVQLYLGKALDLSLITLSAGGRLHWSPTWSGTSRPMSWSSKRRFPCRLLWAMPTILTRSNTT